jgi:hypothetical protein
MLEKIAELDRKIEELIKSKAPNDKIASAVSSENYLREHTLSRKRRQHVFIAGGKIMLIVSSSLLPLLN